MEKKHICLIDYDMCDWGGVEQVIENLSQAFTADYKVSIISLCSGFLKLYNNISCYTIINRRARMREILIKGYFKLINLLNSNSVDIIIVCESCAGMIVTLIKPFIKAKVIFADHSTLFSVWNDNPVRHMKYLSSKFCDYTVTLTKQNENDYIKYFHFPSKKICYIYNWIDDNVFNKAQNCHYNEKKIITVGRLETIKGYDRLLDIAEIILPKYPDWEWHIYGNGNLYKIIKRKIKDRGLENQLLLKGTSKKILEKYHHYSIFALTSYNEGLPLVLLEAKANYLPSISFNIMAGPSEIIKDKVNGYLIRDGDISGFAAKLEKLMQDESLRYSFSSHAYEGIEKFQKDKILKQWKQLFHKILS